MATLADLDAALANLTTVVDEAVAKLEAAAPTVDVTNEQATVADLTAKLSAAINAATTPPPPPPAA